MGNRAQHVHVAPCLVGTILAFSQFAAVAGTPTHLGEGGISQHNDASFVPSDDGNDGSVLGAPRSLMSATRSLLNDAHSHVNTGNHTHAHAPGHEHVGHSHDDGMQHAHGKDGQNHTHEAHAHGEAPAHAHGDDEDGHAHTAHSHDDGVQHVHGVDGQNHTHAAHAHGEAPAHAHSDDEDGHVHAAHSHDGLPAAHTHAEETVGHVHGCHTHDGLQPHQHGDDGDGHEHDGDIEVLDACEQACDPSSLTGFDCMERLLGGNVIFHYKTFQAGGDSSADTEATMAIETPSDEGWVALGFGSGMLGSPAVIATTSAASGGIGVFNLGAYSPDGITELSGAVQSGSARRLAEDGAGFTLTDASVERAGGRLVARFSRPFDGDFTGDADMDVIVAYHSSQSALVSAHEGREPVSLSLTGGGVTAVSDSTPKLRRVHAALMLTSWGVLIPLGIIMAATLRTVGPKSMWFQLHRATQSLALLLATVGFFIAVANFDSLPKGDSHKTLGIAVMVLGWLQPLNALIRPHAPKEGEKRSVLRLAWQFLHRAVGWVAVSLSISTIFRGIRHAKTYEGLTDNHGAYLRGYTAALIIMALLFIGLIAMHIVRSCRQCRDNDGAYFKSGPASDMAHMDRHPIDSMRPDSP